jgi:hypothetical protein
MTHRWLLQEYPIPTINVRATHALLLQQSHQFIIIIADAVGNIASVHDDQPNNAQQYDSLPVNRPQDNGYNVGVLSFE